MSNLRWLWLVLIVWTTAVRAYAQADVPAPKDPAALKAEGDRAMDALRFEEALRWYDASYAIKADPALLFNQGRALEGLGRLPEALAKLEDFDRAATPELRRKVGEALKTHLDEVRARVATLIVEGAPEGATIRMGDRIIGTAPLAPIKVNAGRARIEVSREGFLPDIVDVDLAGGRPSTVTVSLTRRDQSGTLLVRSPVPGAFVYVDDKKLGQVPVELKLPPGPHLVRVEHAGYETAESRVEIRTAERSAIDVPLYQQLLTEQWWFWTSLIGGVAVAGVAVGVGYVYWPEEDPDVGTMNPEQIVVEQHVLLRF